MYEVNTTKTFSFFFVLVMQFYFLLFNIYKFKIVFIWFADYHSLLPVFFSRLFNKKCVINIGGYDADEILTGTPRSVKEKLRAFCGSCSVRLSGKVITVSVIIK